MKRHLVPFLVFLIASGFPHAAAAQGVACTSGSARGSIVEGSVRSVETGDLLDGRGVFLRAGDEYCVGRTGENGRFHIVGVPEGEYDLTVGDAGYRRFQPFRVTVHGDRVEVPEILLLKENLALDCMALEACRSVAEAPGPTSVPSTPEEALLEAAYRLGIGFAGETWEDESWVACIEGSINLVERLRSAYPHVAASVECEASETYPRPRRDLVHLPSNRPARGIVISVRRHDGVTAEISGHYYVGPLHGKSWTCEYSGGPREWTPVVCNLTGLS